MTDVFLEIVNMSISASYIVLAVLLLRKVLSRAPKWINTLLWGIVAIKLAFPLSIRSPFSLIPSAETVDPNIITDITPSINTGFAVINEALNPIIFESLSPVHYESASPLQIVLPVLSALWLVGIVGIITYGIFSYFKLKKTLNSAVKIEDNIYKASSVTVPFFVRERILRIGKKFSASSVR